MSPDEWSGPVNSGWGETPQQPPQQPAQMPPQQMPQQPPGGAQAWQQQSQAKYGEPSGGGMSLLDPKLLNLGILLGAMVLLLGQMVIIYSTSADGFKIGSVMCNLGQFLVFGAAAFMATMVPNVDKYSKLGYLILAGFAFSVL